jgi:DNA-binding transcriptional MerR regulator
VVQVFSIRDLEETSGVPRTTIHYYLRHGLLPRPQKVAASRSLYTEEHLQILNRIRELKEQGRNLAEIEAELQHRVDEANEATVDLAAQEYERVHNRILALAAREFSAKGYKNTHVTDIMREIGITASVFYAHFPSKRLLLAECVSELVDGALQFVDSKEEVINDPAERLLWLVFAHSRVFDLGSAALAVTRVEGVQEDDGDLSKPIEEGLVRVVQHIMSDIAQVVPSGSHASSVPDELLAHSLFGAFEQTVFRAESDDKYTRKDLLRTHLWLFLAAQAARSGEIDIDARLAGYEGLISQLATQMPELPASLQF